MGEKRQRRLRNTGGVYKKSFTTWSERDEKEILVEYWQASEDVPAEMLPQGLPRKRITGTSKRSPEEAQQRLRRNIRKFYQQPLEQVLVKPPKGTKRLRFGELVQEWLEAPTSQRKISDVMRRKYRRNYELHIKDTLGNDYIDKLTQDDFANLLDVVLPAKRKMKNKQPTDKPLLSSNSLLNIYKTCSSALTYGVNRGYILRNPIKGVVPPEYIKPDENVPQMAHIARHLLAKMNAANDPNFTKMLMAFLGLRRGEKLGLTWENVRLTGTKPRIIIKQQLARHETKPEGSDTLWYIKPKTKTGKDREIPLFPPFLDALKEHKKRMDALKKTAEWQPHPDFSDLVFLHEDGSLITLNQDNLDLRDAFDKYGIKEEHRFRGHLCRHITSTLLADIEPPVPESVVRQILGHETVSMGHYYTRMTQKRMAEPMRIYGETFGDLIKEKKKVK